MWRAHLIGSFIAAGPISLAVNGKQLVSIMAGSSLLTLGLREP
jgi:hypothetical protein